MAATTVDRNTIASYVERGQRLNLKIGEKIPAGVMVCADANGDGVNGSDTVNLVCAGRSEHSADQTLGDADINVTKGVFGFGGSAALIAAGRANIGRNVYIVDNQTVGVDADAVNNIIAGVLEDIDGATFYVAIGL